MSLTAKIRSSRPTVACSRLCSRMLPPCRPDLRKHVRYPEIAARRCRHKSYGLYHMTDPEVFYNREDLWSVASEVAMTGGGEQTTQTDAAEFRADETAGRNRVEFVEILPFTPANRNNLIGWIAGRSDGAHYGTSVVYNFPKTKLIDGPLQIEARIDQNAQLSGQLTLWNQQGSHVRRGSMLVIPIRARAVVRGADLPAGRAKSHAGIAPGRARAARPTGIRANLRISHGGAFWEASQRQRSAASLESQGAPRLQFAEPVRPRIAKR